MQHHNVNLVKYCRVKGWWASTKAGPQTCSVQSRQLLSPSPVLSCLLAYCERLALSSVQARRASRLLCQKLDPNYAMFFNQIFSFVAAYYHTHDSVYILLELPTCRPHLMLTLWLLLDNYASSMQANACYVCYVIHAEHFCARLLRGRSALLCLR